jgi:hypothetical protein
LEFSRAQRWRAEPLLRFRTTRPSFAKLFRATGINAPFKARVSFAEHTASLRL